MPFRLFHDFFPEIAEKETRSVFLPMAQGGLPAGGYAFKEMFCDEPGCDCRRAFFLVDTSFRDGVEAVIAWGWEDLEFYRAWMKYGDKAEAKHLQGPELNIGSPETSLAPHLLKLFREVLLQDVDYIERVKRHYRIFRGAVEDTGPKKESETTRAAPSTEEGCNEESTEMSRSSDPMMGKCFLCDASVPKAQATRHVAACLQARPPEPGRAVKTLHLRVEGKYNPEYWMHLEIPSAWTLYELDEFLRQTWLECCGHMSCFTIGGQRYAYEPFNDGFRREKSMDAKLYKAIPPGTVFAHEYDYGSTTDLVLRSMGTYESVRAEKQVCILARNEPMEVACISCNKPATIVEAGWSGLNPERCFCKRCAKSEIEDEGMSLPIVNSPRVGVCAYCGS